MAYVFREYRSNGKPWCIAYKGVDGVMRREKTDAPTKELARKLLAKKIVEVTEAKVAGVTNVQKPITLDDFKKEYIKHIEARKTPQSIGRDHRSLAALSRVFGGRKLKDITPGMVQKYVDDRMHEKKRGGKKTFRPASINRELMCLSAVFREAVKREYVNRNPVRGVKQLPEDNNMVRYLNAEEETKLLNACTPNLRPMAICALNTGMRRGEVLGLLWEDVDYDQELIRLRHTKSKRVRYIPINSLLKATLEDLPKLKDCPWVFFNPETKKRWFDQNTAWKYTIKRSGLVGLRFHDLRHTFASRLVQMGTPLKAVQELLGHATIHMTMRYAHLAPGDLRRAVDLLVGGQTTTQPATQTPAAQGAQNPSDASASAPDDNGGPARTRTGNQGIMSPLL